MKVFRWGRVFSSMMMLPVFVVVLVGGCGGVVDVPPAVPEVVSTFPADGDTDVLLDSVIIVTFSKPMDPLSINTASFMVEDRINAGNNPITGVLGLSGDGLTATFTPDILFLIDVKYRVTLTTGIMDLAGNSLKVDPMQVDYQWDFDTFISP